MTQIIRASMPCFLYKATDRQTGTTSDFLRESLVMFLEHFEEEIKDSGMHKTKNIGFRINNSELQTLGDDIRLSQALRMAVIWRLGVEHGKKL